MESFIVSLREAGRSPSTCANRYRSLQQLFRRLEGEIEHSPMANMRPPKVEEQPVDVFSDDVLRQIFDTCKGRHFEARRDTAIVRLLISTGARVGEIAGLRVEDLDLDGRVAVTGHARPLRGINSGRTRSRSPCAPRSGRGRLRES